MRRSDDESSASYESQGVGCTILPMVWCFGVGTPFMQYAPSRVSAGFLSAYGRRLLSEPFLPHLMVCGLSNHYFLRSRHISMGCLDLLLVVGCSAHCSAVHLLAPIFPLRLDSAPTYNLLVIPLGSVSLSPPSLLLTSPPSVGKYFPPCG